ncbi:MAG: HU family DNA-binding protein [Candidatus Azobacteroides sp.]|nr:HU family DNA-binding protein [Candidatus Azobacteroides sp.]
MKKMISHLAGKLNLSEKMTSQIIEATISVIKQRLLLGETILVNDIALFGTEKRMEQILIYPDKLVKVLIPPKLVPNITFIHSSSIGIIPDTRIRDLKTLITIQAGLDEASAQLFSDFLIKEISTLLETDSFCTLNGLGTFKKQLKPEFSFHPASTTYRNRYRIIFLPEKSFRDEINKAFSFFEPIIVGIKKLPEKKQPSPKEIFEDLEKIVKTIQTSPKDTINVSASSDLLEKTQETLVEEPENTANNLPTPCNAVEHIEEIIEETVETFPVSINDNDNDNSENQPEPGTDEQETAAVITVENIQPENQYVLPEQQEQPETTDENIPEITTEIEHYIAERASVSEDNITEAAISDINIDIEAIMTAVDTEEAIEDGRDHFDQTPEQQTPEHQIPNDEKEIESDREETHVPPAFVNFNPIDIDAIMSTVDSYYLKEEEETSGNMPKNAYREPVTPVVESGTDTNSTESPANDPEKSESEKKEENRLLVPENEDSSDTDVKIKNKKKRILFISAISFIVLLMIVVIKVNSDKKEVIQVSSEMSHSKPESSPNDTENNDVDKVLGVEDIKPGVDLFTLSEKYYGNKIFWIYLYEANKSLIPDPIKLDSGIQLIIPNPDAYGFDIQSPEAIELAKRKGDAMLTEKVK